MAKPKTVIVIDDDPDLLAAAQAILEGAHYTVATALDAETGLARIRQGDIDCIILDVMMATDTEGFHVARDLKADPATAGIPILMLTAVSRTSGFEFSPETDKDYMPVEEFLEKPLDPERLLEAVGRLMED